MDDLFDAGFQTAWTQCWQVTLLIVAVWLTVRYAARNRPHLASVLWLVVLLKCVTPPLWSSPSSVFSWLQAQGPSTTSPNAVDLGVHRNEADFSTADVAVQMPRSDTRNLVLQAAASDAAVRPLSVWQQLAGSMSSWSGVFVLTWLFGCLGFACIACLRGVLCWSRLRRAGTSDAPEVLQLTARLGQRLGLKRPVKVIVSNSPVGPAVVGLFRPVVILPSLIVDAKSLAELEPLLAHELIHIRRGDLWIGLLQLLAQGIWWFHPLVRWSNQWLTRESERCCDEEVIARLGCEPGQYARSLIDVLALKRTLQPIPAFPGVRPVDVTSQRLERIMKLGQGCHKRTPRWCWLVMLLVVAVTLPGAALIVANDKQPAEPVPLPSVSIQTTSAATPGNGTEATTGPLVVKVYQTDDLIRRYREEVQDSEQDAKMAVFHMLQSALKAKSTKVPDEADSLRTVSVNVPHSRDCEMEWKKAQLIVRCRESLQAVVAEELRRLSQDGFAQVQVEVRMLSGNAASMDGIKLEWKVLNAASSVAERGPISPPVKPVSAPVVPAETTDSVEGFRKNVGQVIRGEVRSVLEKHRVNRVAIVNSAKAKAIIEQAQADPRSNILQAPKVTLFSGQNASISDQVQRPFVVAFERENNESKPVIRTLTDGWEMQVRPKFIDERDNLFGLNLNLSLSQIVDVKTSPYPGDKLRPKAVVQCPEVESMKISTTLELRGDQTLVIGDMTRKSGQDDEPFLLLINVKKVVPDGNSKNARAQPEPIPPVDILRVAPAYVPVPDVRAEDVGKDEQRLDVLVYNVADLVIPVPDAELNRSRGKGLESSSDRNTVKTDFAPLEDLIMTTIAPESWDRVGGRGSLKRHEATISLVVRQTAAVHEELQGLLSQIRTLQDLQVTFAVEPIKLTQAEFKTWLDRVDAPAKQKLVSKQGCLAVSLAGPDAKSLRRLSNGDKSVPGLKLTLMNGQQAELPVANDEPREEGVIASLHLLPAIMPELQRVRVNIAAGLSDHSEVLANHTQLVTLNHGESLLVDIAADSWQKLDASRPIPVLENVPYVDRLFNKVTGEPKPAPIHRQFYLLTPKILLVRDVEEVVVPPARGK